MKNVFRKFSARDNVNKRKQEKVQLNNILNLAVMWHKVSMCVMYGYSKALIAVKCSNNTNRKYREKQNKVDYKLHTHFVCTCT